MGPAAASATALALAPNGPWPGPKRLRAGIPFGGRSYSCPAVTPASVAGRHDGRTINRPLPCRMSSQAKQLQSTALLRTTAPSA